MDMDNPLALIKQGRMGFGQTPMRTKEDIERERQKREAAQALEQAANRTDPDGAVERGPRVQSEPGHSSSAATPDVQTGEVSLEATLESQVSALRRLTEEWTNKAGEAIRKRDRYTAEYNAAERFLNELRRANAPEVREEAGDGLRGQEHEGSSGSDELRTQEADAAGAERAAASEEGDPAREADQGN